MRIQRRGLWLKTISILNNPIDASAGTELHARDRTSRRHYESHNKNPNDRNPAGGWFSSFPTIAKADSVTEWNTRRFLRGELRPASLDTPTANRIIAIMHTAIYEAVNAITKRYPAGAVKIDAPDGAFGRCRSRGGRSSNTYRSDAAEGARDRDGISGESRKDPDR
jgi:hypothetical protein